MRESGPAVKLVCADAIDYLERCGEVRAVFMDPPDNLGVKYDGDPTDDVLAPSEYYCWLDCLLSRALVKADVIWLSYYHAHDLEVKSTVRYLLKYRHPSVKWRQYLWMFTFAQYDSRDHGVAYRPILRLSKPQWEVNRELLVPSDRQMLGDKRASPDGKLPTTTLSYPRVVGNAKERRPWHPTQHPQELVRHLMLSSLRAGDEWLDLFGGTGTSIRAAAGLDCRVTVVERSAKYCAEVAAEHGLEVA